MFGIFQPPRYHIRKRVPAEALASYALVETAAEMHFSHFETQPRENAIAVVLSVWVCNALGEGALPAGACVFIETLGKNALARLNQHELDRLEVVLRDLASRGVIPIPGRTSEIRTQKKPSENIAAIAEEAFSYLPEDDKAKFETALVLWAVAAASRFRHLIVVRNATESDTAQELAEAAGEFEAWATIDATFDEQLIAERFSDLVRAMLHELATAHYEDERHGNLKLLRIMLRAAPHLDNFAKSPERLRAFLSAAYRGWDDTQ